MGGSWNAKYVPTYPHDFRVYVAWIENVIVSGAFSKVPPDQAVGVVDLEQMKLLQPLRFHLVEGAIDRVADPVAEDAAEDAGDNVAEDVAEDEVEQMV